MAKRRNKKKRRHQRQARRMIHPPMEMYKDGDTWKDQQVWQQTMQEAKNPASGISPHPPRARTEGQGWYIDAINNHDLVLCNGPAGTGKTHIAIGSAAFSLRKKVINRIVLCRPVVEVGRSIGYLPGDVEAKLGPYLKPLYDELGHYVETNKRKEMLATERLEICPLGMMRGRTFRDCYVILDEAQNATFTEIEMLLTRLGEGSKMILVGDTDQSDLPSHDRGGFLKTMEALSDLDGVAICHLDTNDIVRHKLVSKIIWRINRAKKEGHDSLEK